MVLNHAGKKLRAIRQACLDGGERGPRTVAELQSLRDDVKTLILVLNSPECEGLPLVAKLAITAFVDKHPEVKP